MGGFSLGSRQESDLHGLRSPGKKVLFNTSERINKWMIRWEILKTRLGFVSQWQGRHQSTSTPTLHQAVIGQKLLIIWCTLSALDKFPQQENLQPKTSALSICSPYFSSITYMTVCFVPSGLMVVVSWISFAVRVDAVPGRWQSLDIF